MTSHGQVKPSAEVVTEVARLRKSGQIGGVVRMLEQTEKAYPRSVLDALGDSLVALVIQERGASSLSSESRLVLLSQLHLSGMTGVKEPYAGAGIRLYRIAMESSEGGLSGAAIGALSSLPNAQESAMLLRRIAISNNVSAYAAVAALSDGMAERGGLKVLRELVRSGEVKDPTAREALDFVARRNGWIK